MKFGSNKARRTLVRQQGESDCGVACLASIALYHGLEVLLEDLRYWSGTFSQGTTLLGLKQAAGQIGFEADGYEISIQQLSALTEPCILPVRVANLDHYWVYYGHQNGTFGIGDPSRGIRKFQKDNWGRPGLQAYVSRFSRNRILVRGGQSQN